MWLDNLLCIYILSLKYLKKERILKKIFVGLIVLLSANIASAQSFTVVNSQVEQGGFVVVKIAPQWHAPAMQNVAISGFNNKYIPNHEGYVFMGISSMYKPGRYTLSLVDYSAGQQLSSDRIEIEIIKTNFPKTRTAGTGPSSRPRKQSELDAIREAFNLDNKILNDLTYGLSYVDPIKNRKGILSPFGLIYRNIATRLHGGIDFEADIGTSVYAVNKGQVVLVANDYSKEGNMVILYHGLSVFTVYMHLSEIYVLQGSIVEREDTIGLSGDTGAGVIPPHLHFSVKIATSYIDPLNFLMSVNGYLK
jgi:hypothetical protein